MDEKTFQNLSHTQIRDATVAFLVKRNSGEIKQICLAMKKRGFGVGKWNGVGGKVEDEHGETIEEAARRETKEEINVDIKTLDKVAEMTFHFSHNPDWDQRVHAYLVEEWTGEPEETEEMNPKWFSLEDIPFSKMWADDEYWLPEVLNGNLTRGVFVFGKGNVILEKKVEIVKQL